jgi:hypothetical protein
MTREKDGSRSILARGFCLGLALMLGGCSGEPGEGEIRRLVETYTRKTLTAQGIAGFDGFEAFRKQGCVVTKDRTGDFDCYYNATFAATNSRPKVTVNGKGRFHHADRGWTFEDLGAMRDDRAQAR